MALREALTENGRLLGAPSGIPSTTVFRGVPYARPPIGPLRWAPPAPAESWSGLRLAHSFAHVCIQPPMPESLNQENLEYPEPMSEDCLYLNIWTPAEDASARLPVLFWIHGGAFYAGHSYGTNVDGDAFARRGVILVSVGYRLGPFGFLCHPELRGESAHSACGNYGLLDQLYALHWVRRNIAAFGGDPDKITIAGQSAGASSVQALLSSPLSRGCVAGAVLMSGVGVRGLDFIEPGRQAEAEAYGTRLFAEMGLSSLKEARGLDGETFFARAWAASAKLSGPMGMPFRPVVDGYVLPQSQADSLMDGQMPDIPYMVGHTEEWLLDPPAGTLDSYEAWTERKFGKQAEAARAAFAIRSQADLSALRPDSIRTALIAASHAFCHRLAEAGRQPCYYYHFRHPLPGDSLGAYHGGELWYFFNKLHRNWRPFTGFDHYLADICTDYLANFVKYGNPNADGLPAWSPDTAETPSVMLLENPPRCRRGQEHPGIAWMIRHALHESPLG